MKLVSGSLFLHFNNNNLLTLICPGGHSLVSSVPMRDQKNDEKGYFFSRRAVRSADIIKGRQNVVFVEKGYVFYNSTKTL